MRADQIADQLKHFDQNPKAAMAAHPQKWDAQGNPVQTVESAFDAQSIRDHSYVVKRDQYRKKACTERDGQIIRLDQVLPGRAPFLQNDLVDNLVDVAPASILRRLEDIEQRGLLSAKLAETPWSSTYWPIYCGITGARYADDQFPANGDGDGAQDWKANHAYVLAHPPKGIVASGDQAAIDKLSPAEKFDLLVGDDGGSLAAAMWAAGQQYQESSGKVETWMGICHGWSPAAYMVPRPLYKVEVPAADGRTKLTFLPDDIKALACLLWANTNPVTRFIGGRCNDKTPVTDANGRMTSQDCFDTNPGTWHMAVVNQIGVARRSFVVDATFDYEVWNQPAYSYSYTYFNPQTRKAGGSLHDATVARAAFTADHFSKYRSPAAAYYVGIAMDFAYVRERNPDGDPHDNPSRDVTRTVRYMYDVELDANHQIIGGEWYSNAHPDFMWTPPPGGQAVSVGDNAATGDWGGSGPYPAAWLKAAPAAARYGQPLAKIVNLLVRLSQ